MLHIGGGQAMHERVAVGLAAMEENGVEAGEHVLIQLHTIG